MVRGAPISLIPSNQLRSSPTVKLSLAFPRVLKAASSVALPFQRRGLSSSLMPATTMGPTATLVSNRAAMALLRSAQPTEAKGEMASLRIF